VIGAATVATTFLLAACGSGPEAGGGAPALTWAVGPDRLDAAALASTCTDQSEGRYSIDVEQLPSDLQARHDLLVRRVLAGDDSIDLLSLDSALTTELAAADRLAQPPAARHPR
jgi:multiple sugar transport system substrate-binding protein